MICAVERPVFHELTRTMQTRKLIAGETLLLEEEKGFCMVVDGLVQIFVKSDRVDSDDDASSHRRRSSYEDDDDHPHGGRQGYQLLTEVKNGASMSSLFSILALFTEDVKLRHESIVRHASSASSSTFPVTPLSGPGSPDMNGGGQVELTGILRKRASSPVTPERDLPSVPPLSLDTETPPRHSRRSEHERPHKAVQLPRRRSVHPDIVARATTDTTIAIIPATAFHRLTRVYPRATAHIVQVILTRLQRVTLATAYQYLGLTTEVLRTEKNMSQYINFDLPNHLRGLALERLKEKFRKDRESAESDGSNMKGIALHNPGAALRRSSNDSLQRILNLQRKSHVTQNGASVSPARPVQHTSSPGHRHGVSAGDLLSNIQISRFGAKQPDNIDLPKYNFTGTMSPPERPDVGSPLGQREKAPFQSSPRSNGMKLHRQESVDEDDIFRQSILDCVFRAIGLASAKDGIKRPAASVEQSPRMLSYDAQTKKALFSNAFGQIDPYESSIDGESESAQSTGGASLNVQNLAHDLRDELEVVYFPKDAVLVEQGERNPGLYYVIDGFLDVSTETEDQASSNMMPTNGDFDQDGSMLPPLQRVTTGASLKSPGGQRRPKARKSLYMIKPGGLAGYIGTVSSHRSFVDIRAKTDVYVGFLPRSSVELLVEKFPIVLLTLAKRMTSLLPRLIRHIDFALEWVQISAGQVIHHQGDESDAIYIVLNGRLRAILEKGVGDMQVAGEYGQGESVGELEVMTESKRPTTLHAIRDTEVAKFPKTLFNSLALEHPGITIKISKIIAHRMRSLIEDPVFDQGLDKGKPTSSRTTSSTVNLRTVAVLPVTAGVPVTEFGNRLHSALMQIGVVNGVTTLNQAAIFNHLGRHAFSRMGKLKLSQYLADLEERYGMLLYIADTNVNSPWTQTCISQADCILLVGLAEGSPSIGEYERFLLGMKTTSRKELVLLHAERYSPPGLTRRWLRNRMWINGGHHHIQMSFLNTAIPEPAPQIRRFGNALKQRVQILQAEIQKYTSRRIRQSPLYSSSTPFKGDFHRLARRLRGKSVGLVLGGGGARGIAHIGVIRALEESGIPIDIVGGTSIGAFIGALYARDADVVPMYGRAKKFAGRMGSMWRFALDLTYPSASYTTGHEFNRGIFKTFGNSQIEDFWLQFYCNTTNISKSRMEIHDSGYVWRYVRASMSLAGLLPPLCDEGSMLLDGGYIDNLTVAHMKARMGADIIFAIDVGSLVDHTPQNFGDSLSGFWAWWNRFNLFSSFPNPPTLSEIQGRLAYVSSVDALERAKQMQGVMYMRPPIDPFGTLEFGRFDEILRAGYLYGREYLEEVKKGGGLGEGREWGAGEGRRELRRTMAPRRASV